MSFEKVKSIKIDEAQQKVFINCASNNCRPLSYSINEYPYFSDILRTKGKKQVEIELLKEYENGNLQEGNTKYNKALKVLYYLFGEKYQKFNWRNDFKDYEEKEKLRNSQEFKDLLLEALNTKFPKEKYIIYNLNNNGYISKITTRFIKYTDKKARAKKFDFLKEAEQIRDSHKNYNYQIEQI